MALNPMPKDMLSTKTFSLISSLLRINGVANLALEYLAPKNSYPESIVDSGFYELCMDEKIDTNYLYEACQNGYYHIVKLLLGKSSKDFTFLQSFNVACRKGHYKIVKYLLKYLKHNLTSYMFNKALSQACYSTFDLKVCELLLKKGVTDATDAVITAFTPEGYIELKKIQFLFDYIRSHTHIKFDINFFWDNIRVEAIPITDIDIFRFIERQNLYSKNDWCTLKQYFLKTAPKDFIRIFLEMC